MYGPPGAGLLDKAPSHVDADPRAIGIRVVDDFAQWWEAEGSTLSQNGLP